MKTEKLKFRLPSTESWQRKVTWGSLFLHLMKDASSQTLYPFAFSKANGSCPTREAISSVNDVKVCTCHAMDWEKKCEDRPVESPLISFWVSQIIWAQTAFEAAVSLVEILEELRRIYPFPLKLPKMYVALANILKKNKGKYNNILN